MTRKNKKSGAAKERAAQVVTPTAAPAASPSGPRDAAEVPPPVKSQQQTSNDAATAAAPAAVEDVARPAVADTPPVANSEAADVAAAEEVPQVPADKTQQTKEDSPKPEAESKPANATPVVEEEKPVAEPAPPAPPAPVSAVVAVAAAAEEKQQSSSPPPPAPQVNNVDEKEKGAEDLAAPPADDPSAPAAADAAAENQQAKPQPPQIKYKEDQWSPANPEGKKQYDRNFLLELQGNPLSLMKPTSLPNLEVVKDSLNSVGRNTKPGNDRGSMKKSTPDFTPDFFRSMQQRNGPQKRGSHQGERRRHGNNPTQLVININIGSNSARELNKSKDAWKPSRSKEKTIDDTAEIYKKMRGILNKLTPEKFDKLMMQVAELQISTMERLSHIIDLVFEKAVDEQAFSTTYAQMCEVLSKHSVVEANPSDNQEKQEYKFRSLLITKCQREFEKDTSDWKLTSERWKEMQTCTDPDRVKELTILLESEEAKMRKRAVGNIRFIGELFKLKMLTSPIMMKIIGILLQKGDEESLECLCKLLTTIGSLLESSCQNVPEAFNNFDKHFAKMQSVVSNRNTSSRVRFLMMDVIDLRRNKWVPRRDDSNPKTKAQIHEEAKREEIEQQMALANAPPARRDDRDRKRRDHRGPPPSEDGWTVALTKRTMLDSSRLQKTFSRPDQMHSGSLSLRGPQSRGLWGCGASGGNTSREPEEQQQPSSTNRYSALMENNSMPGDIRSRGPMQGGRLMPGGGQQPRSFMSKSMSSASSEKDSLLRSVKSIVGHNAGSDRSKPSSRQSSREGSITRDAPVARSALRGKAALNEDDSYKPSIAIIEEYVHIVDSTEARNCVVEKFTDECVHFFVFHSFNWVLDKNSIKRKLAGQLFSDLVVENIINLSQLGEGLMKVVEFAEDFLLDIPRVCNYMGEVLAPCMNAGVVPLKKMVDITQSASNLQADVLAQTLLASISIMGENKVVDMWNESGISWGSLLEACKSKVTDPAEYLPTQELSCLIPGNSGANSTASSASLRPNNNKNSAAAAAAAAPATASGGSSSSGASWSAQRVMPQLDHLIKRSTSDEIINFIDSNVTIEAAKSESFIRALFTAIVEAYVTTSSDGNSIQISPDFGDKVQKFTPVMTKYIDGAEKLELQCIYALQAIATKNQHPAGFLEQAFNTFYDLEIITEDAFDQWVKSTDPKEQLGRGVCLKSVKNFLEWIKDGEEDSEPRA